MLIFFKITPTKYITSIKKALHTLPCIWFTHAYKLFCLWPCMLENKYFCYRRQFEAFVSVADCEFEVINKTNKNVQKV